MNAYFYIILNNLSPFNKKMIIGITGAFGSGKTTVADIFKKYGFEVINADELYHGIYEKDEKLKNKVIKEFGTLDRGKIKKVVFNDYKILKKLNEITHPMIIKEIKNKIKEIKKNNIKNNEKSNIALDVPLLIEAKMQDMVDKIIVVKCNKKIQFERLLKKGKHTRKEIENIISSQLPTEEKIKYADLVVDNSKTVKETEKQVKTISNYLCSLAYK